MRVTIMVKEYNPIFGILKILFFEKLNQDFGI